MTQRNWRSKCYDCPEASEWLETYAEVLAWDRAHDLECPYRVAVRAARAGVTK